jgi:FlaA1/EpsC-like NDP-sugar epimerase
MSESANNTQQKSKGQSPLQLPVSSPTVLLRFRKPLIILAHIIAFAASLMLSFLVLNGMQFPGGWFVEYYLPFLPLFIAVKLVVFRLFKQYRGWWRYVGISDLLGILRASLVSTIIIVAFWFALVPNIGLLRTNLPKIENVDGVVMADMFSTILLLAGLRMVIRLYYEEFRTVKGSRLKRFLIVGAGNAGEALLREIHRMPKKQN